MSCGLNCRFAQNCHFRTEAPKDGDPENCTEYWKLEDYWWDAECDRCQEEYDNVPEENEDDFTEEDLI